MEGTTSRKVRSACDMCHTLKMKCSGGNPCTGCARSKQPCVYSEPNRLGRPKGSKNKKSQRQRTRSKSPPKKTKEKSKPDFLDTQSSPSSLPPEQEGLFGLEELLPGGDADGLQDFLEPNSFMNIDDHTIFPSAPTSDVSWEQSPDMIFNMNAEIASKNHDPISSIFSLGEGDNHHHTIQAADLSLSNEGPPIPQNPSLGTIPQAKSISDAMKISDHCACISNQAKFLSNLKRIEGKYSPAPIPVILQATHDSRVLWERLMHCSSCRRDRDSVAVLMFAIGLRNILRCLQCLILSQRSPQSSDHPLFFGQHTISNHGPDAFRTSTTTHHGSSNRDMFFESSHLSSLNRRSSIPITDTIRVGSFEVPHEEQAFLTDILIARALSKIKSIFKSMVGYLEGMADSAFQSIEQGEKWPVHYVLEDLERLFLATEGSMREMV